MSPVVASVEDSAPTTALFAELVDTVFELRDMSVGAAVSITIALLAPREFAAPGVGRVRVAVAPPVVATMVAPFRDNAETER